MVLDAVKFMRTRTRGSPSWPGPCPQAGYVDADCSDQIAEIACGRGGPYVFKSLLGRFITLGMLRADRNSPEVELAQQLAHGPHVQRHAQFGADPLRHVDAAPAGH